MRADLDRTRVVGVPRRVGLALIAVVGVYVLVSVAMLARVELGLIEYIGLTDLATFVVFVLPVLCCLPTQSQLRYWYLLLLASIAFMLAVLIYLLREPPWRLLREHPGSWILYIGLLIASGSCGSYLYLLRLFAAAKLRRKES